VCARLRLLGVEADGGFAEAVAVPSKRVYELPGQISDEEAAIIEPLTVAERAVEYGSSKLGRAQWCWEPAR
jgi:(R,R)-butanediol dehydrogenase/meso-butanediol dehydrogenase/diacetyl reductase